MGVAISPSAGLVRWGAIAAIVGGALSILFAFVGEDNWAHVPVDAARYALLVVGIVAIHLHLRPSTGFGRLGAVGFYVCLFVFALVAVLDFGIIIDEGVEQTRPRPGAGSPADGGLGALRGGDLARRQLAARRFLAADRRRVDQCVGCGGHDRLWGHAGGMGVHLAHGAVRARMGLAGLRTVVRGPRLRRAANAREVNVRE